MMFEQGLKCRCSSVNHSQQSTFFITEAKPHHSPDRLVDVQHIKLDLSVDLKQRLLKGSCTTEVLAVAADVALITFDAIDLKVEQVLDPSGSELRFDQSDDKLRVFLRKSITTGESATVVVKYSVQEPRAGLYFIAPDKDYPNRPWQLWTQGQDEDNRYWFPCHDAPNEKATTEMVVTVDDNYTAVSNGKLVGATHDTVAKRRTFHYKQSIPHASYLVTLCVGEFIELKENWKNSKGEEIPVIYYTLLGRERETKFCFGKTPKMLEFFSKAIGFDYPYEKYAQVVAWDFIYGGMENTSSTTQTEYTLHPESLEQDYSSEPLVAHELAHQWFGDLLTCKDWRHAWLNEGFATYFESLWTEHEHGRDEFLYELYQNEKIYKEEDSGSYRRPIVTNVYLKPSDIFDRHLYEKGGRVLHMLRKLVGDVMWWKAIGLYVATHQASTVETVDLQRAFESVTGRSLDWFFEQWIYKAGHADVKATFTWVDDKKQCKLTVSQKQVEGDLIPLFRLNTKFKIVTASDEQTHDLLIDQAEQTFWFTSVEKPKFVSLNSDNTILANWDFSTSREMFIAQLTADTDIMGRITAVKALGKDHSRASIDALGAALLKDKFWGVQLEAATALGSVGSPLAFEYLVRATNELSHPKSRRAAMIAVGSYRNEASALVAEQKLKEDLSPLVQQAAAIALGSAKQTGTFEKLQLALGKRESWHDYYDAGILSGLAELKTDDRVVNEILRYVRSGKSMFLRRAAVEALAKYGRPRPAMVLDSLLHLSRDTNFFVRLYAVHALESFVDDSAIYALKRIVDTVGEPRTRRSALLAIKSLREGRSASADLEKLRADFDRMKTQYSELLGRVEKLEPESH